MSLVFRMLSSLLNIFSISKCCLLGIISYTIHFGNRARLVVPQKRFEAQPCGLSRQRGLFSQICLVIINHIHFLPVQPKSLFIYFLLLFLSFPYKLPSSQLSSMLKFTYLNSRLVVQLLKEENGQSLSLQYTMTGVEATGEIGVEEWNPPPTLRYFRRYNGSQGCLPAALSRPWACVDTVLAEPLQPIIISTELCDLTAPQSTEFDLNSYICGFRCL